VLEHAILVPVALFLVLAAVQLAAWFHAANVAQHASARAASVASRHQSSTAAGEAEALATVRDSGAAVAGVSVTGGSTIRATVTVRVSRIVPLFPGTVTRSASEPKERYVPEDER
jgi:Flp pilus assembly protein TadG